MQKKKIAKGFLNNLKSIVQSKSFTNFHLNFPIESIRIHIFTKVNYFAVVQAVQFNQTAIQFPYLVSKYFTIFRAAHLNLIQ